LGSARCRAAPVNPFSLNAVGQTATACSSGCLAAVPDRPIASTPRQSSPASPHPDEGSDAPGT
jgi:hypothetical protein